MNNFKKILLILLLILFFGFLINLKSSQAEDFTVDYNKFLNQAGLSATYKPGQQSGDNYLNPLIAQIISTVVGFIGLIFLLLVITSGIGWMTSGGNEDAIAKAKKRLVNGTIGVGLTLMAFILTNVVYNYFDQQFLKEPGRGLQNPPSFEQVNCTTNAQCSDRTGAISNLPYICDTDRGLCVECQTNNNCGDANYECNTTYGLCVIKGNLNCNQISLRDYCLTDPGCRWETDHGGRTSWEDELGNCVNTEAYACASQCNGPATPYCLENSCVRCTQQNDCGLLGICTFDHTCFFD